MKVLPENKFVENISLDEAMTKSLAQEGIRMWLIPGIHVQGKEIPENADSQHTCVVRMKDGHLKVAVQYIPEGATPEKMETFFVDELSSLEELKAKYPVFAELKGNLLAMEK